MSDRDPGRTALPEPPPGLPMYLAGYMVAVCGFYTAYVGLDIGEPFFLVVVLLLTTVGYTVSFLTRSLPSASWSFSALAGSAVGVVALRALASGSSSGLFPAATDGEVHKNLGVFLCWLLVLLSFAQLSHGWLLFSCVPTAAIMGLVGTAYAETDFLTAFALFVLLGTFMLVYDHHSRIPRRTGPQPGVAAGQLRLFGQIYVAALCSLGAVIAGRVVAHPLQAIGQGLGYPVVPADSSPGGRAASQAVPIAVSERTDIYIGMGAPSSASDETLVMRVRAEHGAYWRGTTFDVFTGRGWRNSQPKETVGPVPSRGAPSALFDPRDRASLEIEVPVTEHNAVPGPSHMMNQFVYLEAGARFEELYGAGEPRLYRVAEQATYGLPISALGDASGNVSLTRPIAGTAYEVQSEIPDWDPASIRTRRARMSAVLQRTYTSLEVGEAARVRLRRTALTASRSARTDYDRVIAIQRYIARTCRYNLEAAPLTNSEEDAVTQFLFHTREGYCDLFASALAVLCRAIGMPARVASGFACGEWDPTSLEYFVRAKDKHMWTEVFFEGVGWVPFEATEGSELVQATGTAGRFGVGVAIVRALFRHGALPPLLAGAALLLILYAVLTEGMRRMRVRRRQSGPGSLSPHATQVLDAYAALNRWLDRRGLGRGMAETPEEFAVRLTQTLVAANTDPSGIEELTDLVIRARYAGDPMAPENARQAQLIVADLMRRVRSSRIQTTVRRRTLLEGAR